MPQLVLPPPIPPSHAITFPLLPKLPPLFLLIPLTILLIFYIPYNSHSTQLQQKIHIPYFLIPFIIIPSINTFL
ncbi:putative sulfate exporter family transporter, partial [Staphylococcus epidermidis]|uniref:putative sulfate exporter family transporter n=1 Tax=Staphylococcus epidermidis TaxID=1282 RepID=UPI0037DA4A3F